MDEQREEILDETGESGKRTWKRGSIEAPYIDLDEAIKVAEAIHRDFGSKCSREQLSAALDLRGGAFNRRTGGARIFGLIEIQVGEIRISELGRRIIDPSQAAAARVSAFMAVELYEKIYTEFRTSSLPGDKGLENRMRELGVPENQTATARQLFRRSARQAGFFQYGESRLVMPAIREDRSTSTQEAEEAQERPQPERSEENGHFGEPRLTPISNAHATIRLHPALVHSLDTLPAGGETWTLDDLEDWLDGFKGVLRIVYKIKRAKP